MNDNESIIEKIRACLRLAKSSNPHEANVAMQSAMRLASKHKIDLDAISPDDELHVLKAHEMPLPSRLAHEWKEALNVVHAYFDVNVTVLIGMSSKKAQIIGTTFDIEIASYVATFLVRACRDCLASYRKEETAHRRKVTANKTHSFIKGFFWGIRHALKEQRQAVVAEHTGYQLMIDNGRTARDEAAKGFNRAHGPRHSLAMPEARHNRRASLHGFMQGHKTQIRPGLRGGETLALE